jgi:hypothetical protein
VDNGSLAVIYPHGSVGLGILSWHGHTSLGAALKSYAQEDFFSLFDECMLFAPEADEKVIATAQQYPVRIESASDNKGILSGMAEIAERLTTDYIFFTENDCPLVEPRENARQQISTALELLHNGKACMARMRHTRQFGETFGTYDKYLRYYPTPDSASANMRRILRPAKAKRLCGTSIYVEDNPAQKFPKYIRKAHDGFYLVDASVMPWTNQSILIQRDFFLDTIIPYCVSAPLRRTINGFRNLEIELNQSRFWTESGWKIACGTGLLTHKREDDRGY